MILAVTELKRIDAQKKYNLLIIGAHGLSDQLGYFEELKNLVKAKGLDGVVEFIGPVKHEEILPYLQNADLFINLSDTGSLDKAVLEAMSCQNLVLTSNDSFKDILPEELVLRDNNPAQIAKSILKLSSLGSAEVDEVTAKLRYLVKSKHNLYNLVEKIIKLYA